MRRWTFVTILACSAALFVAVAGPAWADETTPPPTVTTPTASNPPNPPPPVGPKLIEPGVTIGGLLVGGLTGSEARGLVEDRFQRPVRIIALSKRMSNVDPRKLGAAAYVGKAVKTALRVRAAGFAVPLKVDVKKLRLERFLADIAAKTDRNPVDATLTLNGFTPVARKSKTGIRLKQVIAFQRLSLAIRKHERGPFELPYEELRPTVTEDELGQLIVIRRDSKTLLYYDGLKLQRSFRIATGQSSFPTPVGNFEIITMQRDPWWYPPEGSEWAEGQEPVPPGPSNPLGTRWMGISSPYVGIHGTPNAASIGYSASHGCIRMLIPEVEWLFEQVDVGTPVFIVRA